MLRGCGGRMWRVRFRKGRFLLGIVCGMCVSVALAVRLLCYIWVSHLSCRTYALTRALSKEFSVREPFTAISRRLCGLNMLLVVVSYRIRLPRLRASCRYPTAWITHLTNGTANLSINL